MKQNKDLNKLSFIDLKNEVEILEKKKEKVSTKNVGVWKIGKNYFIRTVTMNLMGKLVNVTDKELVLEQASWIADTGRFSNFIKECKQNSSLEVEPYGDEQVIVSRGALIDATIWTHELLTTQK